MPLATLIPVNLGRWLHVRRPHEFLANLLTLSPSQQGRTKQSIEDDQYTELIRHLRIGGRAQPCTFLIHVLHKNVDRWLRRECHDPGLHQHPGTEKFAPRWVSDWSGVTRTSWQVSDQGENQPPAHGGDRVWNVALGTQRRSLWADNWRQWQVAGTTCRDAVLKGESSPFGRSGIRKLRCTTWRDEASHASRALQSARVPPP